jgi:hypothetical protein
MKEEGRRKKEEGRIARMDFRFQLATLLGVFA